MIDKYNKHNGRSAQSTGISSVWRPFPFADEAAVSLFAFLGELGDDDGLGAGVRVATAREEAEGRWAGLMKSRKHSSSSLAAESVGDSVSTFLASSCSGRVKIASADGNTI